MDKDRELRKREQELSKVLSDFQTFDLTDLKRDIGGLVDRETARVLQDHQVTLQRVNNVYTRILVPLTDDHLVPSHS
jgi:cytidylate kinase